tara:strand:- start:28145 stop:28462 length:318 start_codon:yes stop_codon:yes gene_type:complete
MENLELEFLAGNYFDYEIPTEKSYLLKYFKTKIQLHFLKYYLKFGSRSSFADHTGIYCSDRYLLKLEHKLQDLEDAVKEAKLTFSFETLEVINLGKWKSNVGNKG